MSATKTLTDTVWQFMGRAGELYARMEEQRFCQEMQADCMEKGMQSPIEHLFWIACTLLTDSRHEELNPYPRDDGAPDRGIYLCPQAPIDKYRVDFLLYSAHIGPPDIFTPVVVELDGHDFHDRDKRQRSYEKKRDRDLQRAGYRVIHFTGSDVVKDPFACAWEALQLVGLFCGSGCEAYNPLDPLAQGD